MHSSSFSSLVECSAGFCLPAAAASLRCATHISFAETCRLLRKDVIWSSREAVPVWRADSKRDKLSAQTDSLQDVEFMDLWIFRS